MAKYAPLAGPYTRYLLLGGRQVAQGALIRFYVLHVIALPLIGFILMVIHFWRVRKDGFTGGLGLDHADAAPAGRTRRPPPPRDATADHRARAGHAAAGRPPP